MTPDRRAAAEAIDAFVRALGRTEPDVAGTGARVAEMFIDELCSGYAVDTRALLEGSTLPGSGIVAVRDIALVTTCPHHLVPSTGHATVAFLADTKLVGLGAVTALVGAHARRLALQERIGEGVVADLDAVLGPVWVGCRIVLSHACMLVRGERSFGTTVETIAQRAPSERVLELHRVLGVGAGR